MTNREAWEEAAGYGLEDYFFKHLNIDPDDEYVEVVEVVEEESK